MSSSDGVICDTCGKQFTSRRYYKSHFRYEANTKCRRARDGLAALAEKRSYDKFTSGEAPTDKDTPDARAWLAANRRFLETLEEDRRARQQLAEQKTQELSASDDEISSNDSENLVFGDNSDNGSETFEFYKDALWVQFKEYCDDAEHNLCELTKDFEAGIGLMRLLAERRVPLVLYNDIFQWHTEYLEATKFINRKKLISDLGKRYNMESQHPFVKNLELPHSKARIKLVCHDFKAQLQSLLTDPRIQDDDYLFSDGDPFAAPPAQFLTISDINTGLCYRETWKKLITDPTRQVLLPIIFYMDGAVTGQFDALPIEALKFTIGIFNAVTRDKWWAWRNIGYVTNFLKSTTTGRDIVRDSEHMDADIYLSESNISDDDSADTCPELGNSDEEESEESSEEEEEDNNNNDMEPQIKTCKGEDLHEMLRTMLSTYKELEEGFSWNLHYKGKNHEVEFIPFVMFIKGDSVEHDKHCGSYTIRTKHIKQLCRYCCCPNEKTDEAYRRDKLKCPGMIKTLVDLKDMKGLQELSQQYINNAWYEVRFGLHNQLGVHGACPVETLHWIQLGKYKYEREMFFEQTGKDSKLSNEMNALAASMGFLFARQSDRDLPRTRFSKGLKKGKLMAHEMTGLMIILLACLRCTKGREVLLYSSRGKQKQFFEDLAFIKDWIMLLETLLQWEAWLNLPELRVYDVRRSKTKVREMMEMEKKIGRRTSGMGFRTFNFHAALHVADDILNFGVPKNVNTMSNEMHHKGSKTAAVRTQRRPKTFDYQCAKQIHLIDVVDVGVHEVHVGDQRWKYSWDDVEQMEEDQPQQQPAKDFQLTGTKAELFRKPGTDDYRLRVLSEMSDKRRFVLGNDLTSFLRTTMELLGVHADVLRIYTDHKRLGQIFRGSPRKNGKPWRDWVMIDWGEDSLLPGQIWCFVDLREIPDGLSYEPGIYAVIESAEPNMAQEEENLGHLFVPFIKETITDNDGNVQRKFYLVDVESFAAPACLIPDIGNDTPGAFLRLVPRSEWSDQFIAWLHVEHTREFTE